MPNEINMRAEHCSSEVHILSVFQPYYFNFDCSNRESIVKISQFGCCSCSIKFISFQKKSHLFNVGIIEFVYFDYYFLNKCTNWISNRFSIENHGLLFAFMHEICKIHFFSSLIIIGRIIKKQIIRTMYELIYFGLT